ncbi:hypothetical protein N431DRAFT_1825 [Stipitochalara longipes BDJ]|nr:hypothetical protein N431DRAFT_1825 [Stipitochalara longipes BDJ]
MQIVESSQRGRAGVVKQTPLAHKKPYLCLRDGTSPLPETRIKSADSDRLGGQRTKRQWLTPIMQAGPRPCGAVRVNVSERRRAERRRGLREREQDRCQDDARCANALGATGSHTHYSATDWYVMAWPRRGEARGALEGTLRASGRCWSWE